MAPEPETRDMQLDQQRHALAHREAAREARDADEARSEERRAAKAAYLGDKLAERGALRGRVTRGAPGYIPSMPHEHREHVQKAEAVERELADMERLGDSVDHRIAAAKTDWERKKADDSVPGAGGKPNIAQQGPPPEAGNQ